MRLLGRIDGPGLFSRLSRPTVTGDSWMALKSGCQESLNCLLIPSKIIWFEFYSKSQLARLPKTSEFDGAIPAVALCGGMDPRLVSAKLIEKSNKLQPRAIRGNMFVARDNLSQALDGSFRDFHAVCSFLLTAPRAPSSDRHARTLTPCARFQFC